MNKRGEEKLLSIWMFFVWIVVGTGIVAGVLLIYGTQVDVRSPQADALAKRVADCIYEDGYLINGFGKDFDFFPRCNINKKLFDENKLFFKVDVIEIENGESLLENPIIRGNPTFDLDCKIGDLARANNYPVCSQIKMSVLYRDGSEVKMVLVDVTGGSNVFGGRV